MKTVLALVLAAALAACSTVQSLPDVVDNGDARDEVAALLKLTKADLEMALQLATDHDDPAGVQCYSMLLTKIDGVAEFAAMPSAGVVSAYEKARILRRRVEGRSGEDVRVACSALVNDSAGVVLRLVRRAASLGL